MSRWSGPSRPRPAATARAPSPAGAAPSAPRGVFPPPGVPVRWGRGGANPAPSGRVVDLVPEPPGRRASFRGGSESLAFDVAWGRPGPPGPGRDGALAVAV